MCEAFGCSPREAERQDPELVRRVFEVRNARHALDLMNQGEEGAKRLGGHPELLELLNRIQQAQIAAEESIDA